MDKVNKYLLLILATVGVLWLRFGFGKFQSGNFVESLGGTLNKFADKNPYPWYKSFLQNFAIPNSQIFGVLTMWGELLSGISIILASVYLLFVGNKNKLVLILLALGLMGGAFLNIIFWLASGWTSPSTDGLNLLMLAVEIIGFAYIINLLKNK